MNKKTILFILGRNLGKTSKWCVDYTKWYVNAYLTKPTVLLTPSFIIMFWRWVSTVLTLTNSFSAIWELLYSSQINFKISLSRLLKTTAELLFIYELSWIDSSLEKFKSILDAESGANPHGFGLWVCQEFANHYGGDFYLDDTADDQTRLVFWVPNRESKGTHLWKK